MGKRLSGPGLVVWPVLLVAVLLTPTVSWDAVPLKGTGAQEAAGRTISADFSPQLSAADQTATDLPTELGTAPPPAARLYVTAGLGFIDTKREVGADVPLGVALLLERYRLLAAVGIFDIAMIEGSDRDPRYYRPYPGYSNCLDTSNGRPVPDYLCSGGTDFTVSSCADLSYVVFDEVWFSDKPGKVTLGMGYRLRNPASPYATIGVFFPSRGRSAAGARLDMGPDLIHMGVTWGLDLVRFLRR